MSVDQETRVFYGFLKHLPQNQDTHDRLTLQMFNKSPEELVTIDTANITKVVVLGSKPGAKKPRVLPKPPNS